MRCIPKVLYISIVAMLGLGIVGCLPKPPVRILPGPEAHIVTMCSQCLAENVGYAPLTMVFYAQSPEAEEYLWDFGDGAQKKGRLVQHTFVSPGTFEVTLIATSSEKLVVYKSTGKTAVFALEPPDTSTMDFSYENEFVLVKLILPRKIALGERFLVRYIITAKAHLVYIDLRSVPNERVYSENEGYFQKLRIPPGAAMEFSYYAKAIAQGVGAVETILLASDGTTLHRMQERAEFYISDAVQ